MNEPVPSTRSEDASNEARLEAVLESISDGFYALDRDWRYVVFNRAAEEYFGVSRAELIGKAIWDVFPQGRGGVFERACVQAMGERIASRFEIPSRARAGRMVELRILPMRDAGIAVSLSDITERRRTEDALRASEARLELATQASRLGVWEWNIVTGEMIVSVRAREIWGFSPDQVVQIEDITRNAHPEDGPEILAQSRRAMDPEVRDASPYEYRIPQPDGAMRWVRAHGEPVFDSETGAAVRYVGTVADITGERTAAQDLRESEARLRLAMEAGGMAVFLLTNAGLQGSPELNRLLGLAADAEPAMEEINAGYYPGELERMQEAYREALASQSRKVETEYRYVWPDGQVRWLMVRAEINLGADGEPQSVLGVVLDITERRESEERLKLLAREVDHRANNLLTVVQATVALTSAPTADALKDIITGRVSALAHAHQLISEARWRGAELRRLVEEELRPYRLGAEGRVRFSGPDVTLSPQVAQSAAMALHELATNAAKYGALSRPTGEVSVTWSLEDEQVALDWTETGGPRVVAPTHRGLGLNMLQRALGGGTGGQAVLDWRESGLVARLSLPLPQAP
ncbi:PAS domain S-box protein [Phenylobacterium sp.]|uniref:sensor histidine kinase n=1 Tax=Phenylobacterium sp. TaxID=1871053 RepID=UPI00286DAA22|nr:PAS domain S-box protein [Phenylobacterium sp.]